jgi:hypothetical protein
VVHILFSLDFAVVFDVLTRVIKWRNVVSLRDIKKSSENLRMGKPALRQLFSSSYR